MATAITKDTETGTSGAVTVKVGADTYNNSLGVEGCATTFTIAAVVTGSTPTGTLAITYKAVGGTVETLKDDYGVALTVDVSAPRAIRVKDVAVKEFIFTPSAFSNVTEYTITVVGW